MRKPFGAGWALVGDAGYTKDFITALGISDAFRDAELCATGLDEALSGERPFEVAMADYQTERDRRSLPFYEFTAQLATLQFPPPELEPVLAAVQGNQESMDAVRAGGRCGDLPGGLPVRAERCAPACSGRRAARRESIARRPDVTYAPGSWDGAVPQQRP